MKNLLITLLVATFLVSSCCLSCRDDSAPTYLMDQDFKDYTLFPVGSYWIYSENASQEYDSVYLYQQEIRINESQKIHSYNYEQFDQSLGSTFFRDTLVGGSSIERYKGEDKYCLYAERYLSNFVVTNLQFFNKISAGSTLDFADDSQVKYIGEFNSFIGDGIERQNVRVFENLIQTDDRLPKKIYYAKGIGVVRKELFNGQTWNLKRNFINR